MAHRAADIEPGTVLSGTYEITRKIAQGGMGVVYEARHKRLTGRRVAIKILLANVSDSAEMQKRFRREAEICSRLSHPHIVSVTDWDTLEDGSPFFVMEYLEGESLLNRMQRGPLAYPNILRVLQQAGSALDHAHGQEIVHRDVKPSNIFLVTTEPGRDEASYVKVLDFGISKILSADTPQLTDPKVMGSPGHMSPEQARGKVDRIDARSDQFSLGVIAYELFADQPAFDADTIESLLYCVVHEEPRPLAEMAPELPPYVVKGIERAMRKDPEERFPSVEVMIRQVCRDLVDVREHDTQSLPRKARERQTLEEGPGRTARATVWVAAAIFVLTALAGLGIILFAPDGEEPGPPTGLRASDKVTSDPRRPVVAGVPDEAPDAGVEPASDSAPAPTVQPLEVPEKLDPAVLQKLAEADGFFEKGRYREAIRSARQSIGLQDSARARVVILLSYCAISDLGNARAALYKVSPADKNAALRRCRELGLDL